MFLGPLTIVGVCRCLSRQLLPTRSILHDTVPSQDSAISARCSSNLQQLQCNSSVAALFVVLQRCCAATLFAVLQRCRVCRVAAAVLQRCWPNCSAAMFAVLQRKRVAALLPCCNRRVCRVATLPCCSATCRVCRVAYVEKLLLSAEANAIAYGLRAPAPRRLGTQLDDTGQTTSAHAVWNPQSARIPAACARPSRCFGAQWPCAPCLRTERDDRSGSCISLHMLPPSVPHPRKIPWSLMHMRRLPSGQQPLR